MLDFITLGHSGCLPVATCHVSGFDLPASSATVEEALSWQTSSSAGGDNIMSVRHCTQQHSERGMLLDD